MLNCGREISLEAASGEREIEKERGSESTSTKFSRTKCTVFLAGNFVHVIVYMNKNLKKHYEISLTDCTNGENKTLFFLFFYFSLGDSKRTWSWYQDT